MDGWSVDFDLMNLGMNGPAGWFGLARYLRRRTDGLASISHTAFDSHIEALG